MGYEKQAEWKRSGGQNYLYIQAENRFELGELAGEYLSGQISGLRRAVGEKLSALSANPAMERRIKELSAGYLALIPEEDMEEISGIRAGYQKASGEEVSLEELAFQTFGIDLTNRLEAMVPQNVSLEGCTNFGAVNSDGTTVHGQNYDSSPAMAIGDAFVHQHVKGTPDVFLYRPGASLGMAVGKNETGLLMTVSVVKTNCPGEVMTPRSVFVRKALTMEQSIDAARAMADSGGRSSFAFNLVLSDQKTVTGVQAIPKEQRICQVKRMLVQSNQFDYVDWLPYLKKPSYSKKRQLYAEDLLARFYGRYGKVDNRDLLEILKDEPVICRTKVGDGIGTTVLFMTRESFGLGNPADAGIGKLPF